MIGPGGWRLRELDPALASGRVIVAHLGAGASLCAMRDGSSVETTMGFTALDGLVMGTRCGAIDPGVILYLQAERGMTTEQVSDLLSRRSGLLGVSGGLSSDMRILLASGETRAKEAVELFVYRIALEVGALASALGGLDGLVFTAGIGEHAPEVRAMVAARLGWLGVILDPDANTRDAAVIGAAGSRIQVRVTPTDEEAMIARHTADTVGVSRRLGGGLSNIAGAAHAAFMPQQLTTGAMLACSFGAAPSALTVLPVNRVEAGGTPAATIMDHAPMVNIMPFGVCSSLANPTVAAATTAALGVLTPMPCVPATAAPWAPGVPTTLIGGAPAIDTTCKLMCNWGGVIQVTAPAQVTVEV